MIRLLIVAALILLSGCVHLDEYIQINSDGSAKVVLKYSMPLKAMSLLQDSEVVLQDLNKQQSAPDMPRIFNEEKMRAHFKKFPEVDVISLRVNKDDGKINAYLNLQIEDFRAVLRKGLLPYTSLEKEKENYVFSALYPYNLSKLKKNDAMLEAAKDLQISFKVKTPSFITETNAHKNIANLAEWHFSKEAKSFTDCDGRFIVKFDASKLSFLDKKEEK